MTDGAIVEIRIVADASAIAKERPRSKRWFSTSRPFSGELPQKHRGTVNMSRVAVHGTPSR